MENKCCEKCASCCKKGHQHIGCNFNAGINCPCPCHKTNAEEVEKCDYYCKVKNKILEVREIKTDKLLGSYDGKDWIGSKEEKCEHNTYPYFSSGACKLTPQATDKWSEEWETKYQWQLPIEKRGLIQDFISKYIAEAKQQERAEVINELSIVYLNTSNIRDLPNNIGNFIKLNLNREE